MKSPSWQTRLAALLAACAVVLYAARWFIFNDPGLHNEMWRFLLGDVAFLFVQVPLVTLLIDRVMEHRQREEMLLKLNMVIGAFFSQAGRELLGKIAGADTQLSEVREDLTPDAGWAAADYARSLRVFAAHKPHIDPNVVDLEALRETLQAERGFLLGMLGNQSLLEHQSFTDLLWSLTHLGEELSARADLKDLCAPDAAHLRGDLQRAYESLGREWLAYLQHLQSQYPYLFSLAVRTNPLDPGARAEVV